MASDEPEMLDFPHNWDELHETEDPLNLSSGSIHAADPKNEPLVLTLFAATWADIVAIVAVSTTALLVLGLIGHQTTIKAFPWAIGLAFMWWILAATATIIVRRGTPGMLAAGVILSAPIQPKRVPLVLLSALLLCLSFGLLAFLGAGRSPLSYVSGVSLEHLD
jgi:hypothetical protein